MTPPVHQLDAVRYGKIVESGTLDGQNVELLEGLIVETEPKTPRRGWLIMFLTRHLRTASACVRVLLPLHVASDSVLEPDLALVDEPERLDRHPCSAVLVVEVAVSFHALARGRKADLYAEARVPAYWLVDATTGVVEVRSDPGPAGYRTMETYDRSGRLPSVCDVVGELSVGELLRGI